MSLALATLSLGPGVVVTPQIAFARKTLARMPGRMVRQLTRKEFEVLVLFCAGRSDAEIASDLGKLPDSVQEQLLTCTRKFDAENRLQMMARIFFLCDQADTLGRS